MREHPVGRDAADAVLIIDGPRKGQQRALRDLPPQQRHQTRGRRRQRREDAHVHKPAGKAPEVVDALPRLAGAAQLRPGAVQHRTGELRIEPAPVPAGVGDVLPLPVAQREDPELLIPAGGLEAVAAGDGGHAVAREAPADVRIDDGRPLEEDPRLGIDHFRPQRKGVDRRRHAENRVITNISNF